MSGAALAACFLSRYCMMKGAYGWGFVLAYIYSYKDYSIRLLRVWDASPNLVHTYTHT
jgi:hypothetical protein